ncbi:hypothetical protein E6H15_08810 [Candidatus Bathyarchaeota archaeon]|nr:MAG: hypothetical protein E6H15_08810 [Candidatus Bathyarchaeota archaeon]
MASTRSSQREPVTAGSREFRFYVSKAPEINRRYAGKHVVIIGDRIVAPARAPSKSTGEPRSLTHGADPS